MFRTSRFFISFSITIKPLNQGNSGLMTTEFDCIGLNCQYQRQITDLQNMVISKGYHCATTGGTYYAYPLGEEIELWSGSDNQQKNKFVSVHVTSSTTTEIALNNRFKFNDSPLEGCFEGWVNPKFIIGSRPPDVSGDYPLTFRSTSFHWFGRIPLPCLAEVQLVGFPIKVEFDLTQHKEPTHIEGLTWDEEYLIPTGTFNRDEDDNPAPVVDLGGIIIAQRMLLNNYTNGVTYLVTVRTYGIDLDVVLPLCLLKDPPKVGQVIFGRFLVSGRIKALKYPFRYTKPESQYQPLSQVKFQVRPSLAARRAAAKLQYSDMLNLQFWPPYVRQPRSIAIRDLNGQLLGFLAPETSDSVMQFINEGMTPKLWVVDRHTRMVDDSENFELTIQLATPPKTKGMRNKNG